MAGLLKRTRVKASKGQSVSDVAWCIEEWLKDAGTRDVVGLLKPLTANKPKGAVWIKPLADLEVLFK